MFIYIDESGTFAHAAENRHSYACVGALTVPERSHRTLLKGFKRLKRLWGRQGQEIKGRELDEKKVAGILMLLLENGTKFHACATDMLYNRAPTVGVIKDEQANQLLANITDQHHPNLVEQLVEVGNKIRNLPDQLFIQLCLMIELINAHLHDVIIFFAGEDPTELRSFHWVADRKNKSKTTYEDLWHTLLAPVIQGQQFSSDFYKKIVFLNGGNYEYFKRYVKRVKKWPDYLPEQSPGLRSKTDIEVVDIGPILKESFTLADSAEKQGLQLADVVTNALRRAMMGNLQFDGWSELGRLMFKWKNKSIRLIHFGETNQPSIKTNDPLCSKVIMAITRRAGFVI
jgi:hypothetical protein